MLTINLLNIAFLLVFCIEIGFAGYKEDYDRMQSEHITLANQYRRAFAKKFRISNMHELVWDPVAEKTAQDNRYNNPPKTKFLFRHHISTLLTSDTAKETFRDLIEDRNERYFRDQILEDENDEMYPLELLLPAQKKIGCSYTKNGPDPSVCLLGPENYFGSFFEARGTPGSKCDKGYTNNDGLCSLSKGN
ncbi:unnamed protein product [Caenorhabditis brenneri]